MKTVIESGLLLSRSNKHFSKHIQSLTHLGEPPLKSLQIVNIFPIVGRPQPDAALHMLSHKN